MAQLAIKGHATRGREVIELLEMLGGINDDEHKGFMTSVYYFINDNYIDWCHECTPESEFTVFTLEEFLEKFPFKVGDKVLYKIYNVYSSIRQMTWNKEKEQVIYRLDSQKVLVATADELQPYKEETMEERENSVVVNIEHKQLKVHSLRFDKTQLVINDEYELTQEGDAYYIVRKKKQYPKTLMECCKELDIAVRKMRDAIKEQFDKDLETCKELL